MLSPLVPLQGPWDLKEESGSPGSRSSGPVQISEHTWPTTVGLGERKTKGQKSCQRSSKYPFSNHGLLMAGAREINVNDNQVQCFSYVFGHNP